MEPPSLKKESARGFENKIYRVRHNEIRGRPKRVPSLLPQLKLLVTNPTAVVQFQVRQAILSGKVLVVLTVSYGCSQIQ